MPKERILDEHPRDRAERLLPHRALVRSRNLEPAQLQLRRRLSGAELDAPAAHQIERGDPLCHPRRMIVPRWQQCNSVTEPNLLRPLTRRGQEDLRRRRMRILLEEVMLDFPHMIDAELVRELNLIERVLEQLQLRALFPMPRQLMLIKSSQLHFFSTYFFQYQFFSVSIRGCFRLSLHLPQTACARPCRSLR